MRILFIGGTKRGYLTLKALVENGSDLVGIVSLKQEDHEVERYEGPIKTLSEQYSIPLFETKWMKELDYAALIRGQIKPDVALLIGCRILVPKEVYEIPPLGTLAVHDSLLPEYRGFAPLNWAILNGESQTGVTLFYVSELMDGGNIVGSKTVAIGPHDTAPQVYECICQATIELVLEAHPLLAQGTAPRIRQDYSKGSFTCTRNPSDGLIHWENATNAIYNQVRALTYPYPGAFTYYNGKRMVVWKAEALHNPPTYVGRIPGRVVRVSRHDGGADVLCGDGVLRLLEVQLKGQEREAAANVIESVRVTLGVSLAEMVDRIEVLEGMVLALSKQNMTLRRGESES